MGRPLSSPYLVARSLLADTGAWLTFMEVELAPGQFARLVSDSVNRVAGGFTWQAAAMTIDGIGEDASSPLAQLRVSISNLSGLPMVWIDGLGGVLGNGVTLWLAYEGDLPTLPDFLKFTHTALQATCTTKTATLELGHPAQLQRALGDRYSRRVFQQINAGRPPR